MDSRPISGSDAARDRGAPRAADFFVPYLRPGMRVLDCGCGQGSITLGLAEAVAPGAVVGIDRDAEQVDRARTLAAARGVTNARFDVADVYALPFPDASFDAVFGHQLLLWLREPLAALVECRRVLKAGGIAGVRTIDPSVCAIDPVTPLLERLPPLLRQVWAQLGADWSVGHQQRRLLLEAGFARSGNYAGFVGGGTAETERGLLLFERSLRQPDFRAAALESGVADAALLDAMLAELQSFCARPDAFPAVLECSAIGWVDYPTADG